MYRGGIYLGVWTNGLFGNGGFGNQKLGCTTRCNVEADAGYAINWVDAGCPNILKYCYQNAETLIPIAPSPGSFTFAVGSGTQTLYSDFKGLYSVLSEAYCPLWDCTDISQTWSDPTWANSCANAAACGA